VYYCYLCKCEKDASEFSLGQIINPTAGTCSRIYRKCKACKNAESRAYSARNKDVIAARMKKYHQAFPARVNHQTAKYRIKRLARLVPWANEFFISEAYDLAILREKATGFKWEVDHIIPITHKLVCGLHVENNLQVIPATENIRKRNRFEII